MPESRPQDHDVNQGACHGSTSAPTPRAPPRAESAAPPLQSSRPSARASRGGSQGEQPHLLAQHVRRLDGQVEPLHLGTELSGIAMSTSMNSRPSAAARCAIRRPMCRACAGPLRSSCGCQRKRLQCWVLAVGADKLQLANQLIEMLILPKTKPDRTAGQPNTCPPGGQHRLRRFNGLVLMDRGKANTVLIGSSSDLEPDPLAFPSRLHTPIARENRHDRQSPPGRCFLLERSASADSSRSGKLGRGVTA